MIAWADAGVAERRETAWRTTDGGAARGRGTDWGQTDPSVVRAAREGCEESFATLYDGMSGRVRRVASRILGDAHAADDAVQDTFLAVLQGLPGLGDPAAFETWVLRIARHKAISAARRRLRFATSAHVHRDDSFLAEAGPGVIHRSGAAEPAPLTVLLLRSAYGGLSSCVRETLRLRYREGLSCEAIARTQGVTLSCVKTRLHRGRRDLYAALDREVR